MRPLDYSSESKVMRNGQATSLSLANTSALVSLTLNEGQSRDHSKIAIELNLLAALLAETKRLEEAELLCRRTFVVS
jgi:hypothetical protein